MQHHAFMIEADPELGIGRAYTIIEKELGLKTQGNPDVIVLSSGLLSVEEARRVGVLASQAPITGDKKAIIIAANRAYHEAQNALLKVFEEPPAGTYLFLVLPTVGGLLPTLRSRVQILKSQKSKKESVSDEAEGFIKVTKEKRSALIKKLSSGKDEEDRRENREEAIRIVNGIEVLARMDGVTRNRALLEDIQKLRTYLYDRAAPVRMILEHLSLVLPKHLR